MPTLVTYSDHTDELLGATHYASEPNCVWVSNDIGTAELLLPRSTPNFTDIIQWGNILRVYQPHLPCWVGTVTGRTWVPGGVSLSLKSAEWFTTNRLSAHSVAPGTVTAGRAAKALARSCLNNGPSPLRLGTFDATKTCFNIWNYADLFTELKRMAEEYNAAFWVDEDLKVHFRDKRGEDLRDPTAPLVLREGKHLYGVTLTENAEEVVTAAIGMGSGSSLQDRVLVPRKIPNAVFFRSQLLDFDHLNREAAVKTATDKELLKRAVPRKVVDTRVLNLDGVWDYIRIGNKLELVIHTAEEPTSLNVEVLGMEVESGGSLRVVFDVLGQKLQPTPETTPVKWAP